MGGQMTDTEYMNNATTTTTTGLTLPAVLRAILVTFTADAGGFEILMALHTADQYAAGPDIVSGVNGDHYWAIVRSFAAADDIAAGGGYAIRCERFRGWNEDGCTPRGV